MKKTQHPLSAFEKAAISQDKASRVKGGYKYGTPTVESSGSYVWESVDIRSQTLKPQNSLQLIKRTGNFR